MAYSRSRGGSSSRDSTDFWGMAFVGILLFAIVIEVVYWLALQALWLGPVIMLGALGLYVLIKDSNDDAAVLCFLIFMAGVIIFLFGIGTTQYFQTDPTGRQLINFSNGVINTSQNYVKGMSGK